MIVHITNDNLKLCEKHRNTESRYNLGKKYFEKVKQNEYWELDLLDFKKLTCKYFFRPFYIFTHAINNLDYVLMVVLDFFN